MIERNLGNVERVMRLLLGVGLLLWAMGQDVISLVEWFAVIISVALILNGIFSRCYLWYLLDISTCHSDDKDCRPEPSCP